ncbi:MAG: hypothetical protein WD379_07095 [Dehalococcoidia bacterium]
MPDIGSLTTFSGLMAFFGTLCLLSRQFTGAGLLLLISGAAGTGIFWDRWSERAGDQVHVTALFAGHPPSPDETAMLATHLPLLILGGSLVVAVAWRNYRQGATK